MASMAATCCQKALGHFASKVGLRNEEGPEGSALQPTANSQEPRPPGFWRGVVVLHSTVVRDNDHNTIMYTDTSASILSTGSIAQLQKPTSPLLL